MLKNLDREKIAGPTPAEDTSALSEADTNDNIEGNMPVDLSRQPLDIQSWILIGIGIAFLIGGFLVYFGIRDLPADRHNLTLLIACIGFAVVLTEIGTRAAVRHTSLNTGIVVTGAGALALLFYVLVNPIALCQFGYGGNCPQPEGVRQFTGMVKIPGEELDPRALTVAVVPQTRSASSLGQYEVYWTARFPVKVDDEGNVEEPKHIILSYPNRAPVRHSVPVHLNSYNHTFSRVLEFGPSNRTEEVNSDDNTQEIRLENR